MIRTQKYNISGGRYLIVLLNTFFRWIYLLVAIIIAMLFFLALYDIRFLLVGLMVIFIIIPFAISYLYIWYCLKPESRDMILEKSLEISPSGIELQFDNSLKHFSWRDFSSVIFFKRYIVLIKKDCSHSFIAIPYSAFESPDDSNLASSLIDSHITSSISN